MTDSLDLCAAYIERHPDAAGRALQGVPLADAAALLAALPAGLAAQALARAGAMRAARLVLAMEAGRASAVLAALPDADAAAVLRLIEAPGRDALLAELPERVRRQLADSLDYPADAVGAIMTRSIVALDAATRAADALDALRERGPAEPGCVFATGRDHAVVGIVSAGTLICGGSRSRLAELIDAPPPVLPSRASITSVIEHDAWLTRSVLPVINRERQLVGALTHESLRRHLRQPASLSQTPTSSILLSMSEDMVDSVSGLWGLMLDATPGRTRGTRQ